VWVSEDVVYVTTVPAASTTGSIPVEARSIEDGTVLATFEMPSSPDPVGVDNGLQGTPGDVLFAFDGTGLVAIDGATGATLWTPTFQSVAALDGETVADIVNVGEVSIVDARTGESIGDLEVPCIADRTCRTGYITAVGLADDHLLLTVTNADGD